VRVSIPRALLRGRLISIMKFKSHITGGKITSVNTLGKKDIGLKR
jgi:hypothetical protein